MCWIFVLILYCKQCHVKWKVFILKFEYKYRTLKSLTRTLHIRIFIENYKCTLYSNFKIERLKIKKKNKRLMRAKIFNFARFMFIFFKCYQMAWKLIVIRHWNNVDIYLRMYKVHDILVGTLRAALFRPRRARL